MRILPRAASAAVCAFLFLFTADSSIAQPVHLPNVITRTSVSSGNWNVAATWAGGIVPSGNDSVVIASGTTVTMYADESIGSGTVTVQAGAVLDVRVAFLTASRLVVNDGGEFRQGGSQAGVRTSIDEYQLAPDSTFTYYGNISGLNANFAQPTYGNLNFRSNSTSSSPRTMITDLTVLGTFLLDIPVEYDLQFEKGHTYSFGRIVIERGTATVSRSSATSTATISVSGDVVINAMGTLRGTASSGHANLNIGGDLINNGTFQQDDGDSTGVFTVNLNGTAEQHISGLNAISFENLTINNSAGVVLDRDVSVDKGLTLTSGRVNTGDFTLLTGSSSTIAGAGENSYIEGYIAKEFSSNGSFVFPVGTDSGYSPVTATITALPTNPSKLSVAAFNGAGPGVDAANSVTRFWNIIEEGDLTANLIFSYRDADVTTPAAEANYSLVKKDGNALPVVVCTGAGCINAAANTASAGGVTGFSRWAIGAAVAPSSADAAVAGRVLDADARAVRGAFLTAVGTDGRVRYAVTNQFGHYSFRSLSAGETYTISVRSKQYTFAPSTRVITLNDAETDLDFIAEAP